MVRLALVAVLFSFLGACAVQPQLPVNLSGQAFEPEAKIGIAMSEVPSAQMTYPGASCLLCLAAAAAANSKLSSYAKTLSAEDLKQIPERIQKKMAELGYEVMIIDSPLMVKNLPKFGSKLPNTAKKNFEYFKTTYDLDYLIGVEVDYAGLQRNYSSYIPTSSPQVVVRGRQYAVRISDNTYNWYKSLDFYRSAEGEWKEPPNYPGITNAYYQALELVLDEVVNTGSLQPAVSADTVATTAAQ